MEREAVQLTPYAHQENRTLYKPHRMTPTLRTQIVNFDLLQASAADAAATPLFGPGSRRVRANGQQCVW